MAAGVASAAAVAVGPAVTVTKTCLAADRSWRRAAGWYPLHGICRAETTATRPSLPTLRYWALTTAREPWDMAPISAGASHVACPDVPG